MFKKIEQSFFWLICTLFNLMSILVKSPQVPELEKWELSIWKKDGSRQNSIQNCQTSPWKSVIDFAFKWNCNFEERGFGTKLCCRCCMLCNTRVLVRLFVMTQCVWWSTYIGVEWVNITKSLKLEVERVQVKHIWKVRERGPENMQTRLMCLKSPVVCQDSACPLLTLPSLSVCLLLHICSIYRLRTATLTVCSLNALLIFALDIRAGVTQQLQDRVFVHTHSAYDAY